MKGEDGRGGHRFLLKGAFVSTLRGLQDRRAKNAKIEGCG